MNRKMHFGLSALILSVCVPLCLCLTRAANACAPQEKSGLSILYVGTDPDSDVSPPSYLQGNDAERFVELRKERMPAFEAFLKQHFKEVRTVNVKDYRTAMSDDADVTIFDDVPPGPNGVGPGRSMRLKGFDQPAIMIGSVAPNTLDGLQLDWL